MTLKHIPLDQLHVSPFNMRAEKKVPSLKRMAEITANILPTIREKGILQDLIVRPNASGFEILAGRRRYYAARVIEAETGQFPPIQCDVREGLDDAAALEISLIENVAREDADEMTQYEAFSKLVREGRTVESIAVTFGITETTVKQRLALGNLLPKIRDAYRAELIDGDSIRYLTMASGVQQNEWLKLFEVDNGNAPFGHQLKQWLFGGQSIATKAAIFPLEQYTGQIVSDLFGEENYFADTEQFWQLQMKTVEEKHSELLTAKWADVVVLETGKHFEQWAHEKRPKKKGGKVFITVSHRGEVEIHHGYVSRQEARKTSGKKANGTEGAKAPQRPAMTQAMENYLELHRHAAVRVALLDAPDTALRLLVAHAVVSSGNWSIKPDPQRSRSAEIAASIENSPTQKAFETERQVVMKLLGTETSESEDACRVSDVPGENTARIFARLLNLSDAEVRRVAAFAIADTLAVGSAPTEATGVMLKVDTRKHWQPDEAFFSLVRERITLTAMIAETAGKDVAKANAGEKTATLKKIIGDALAGKNGRAKSENWLPGWMAFPFRAYGKGRTSIGTVAGSVARILRKA